MPSTEKVVARTQPDFMNVRRPDVVAFISVMHIRLEEYRWLTTDPIAIHRIYRSQDEPAEMKKMLYHSG
jgi:hypothetical protein